MNPNATLTGTHLGTFRAIFARPIVGKLGWHDVHALCRKLGQVDQESDGDLKVTRNGQSLLLRPAGTKEVPTTDVISLRDFLERSEAAPASRLPEEMHWLLVIDPQTARIFRVKLVGGVPEEILSHKPNDYFRHVHNSFGSSSGKDRTEPMSFFKPVAKALQDAAQILVFSSGKGTSSAIDQFSKWAKAKHSTLAARIIAVVGVEEDQLTEASLLAKAREFYSVNGRR